MSPLDPAWIAEYDQRRAVADECLDGLVKLAQLRSESPTETFLTVMGTAQHLSGNPGTLAAVLAAAVTRLAGSPP